MYRSPVPEIGTQLANLYRSSHDLIDRFGLTPDMETAWYKLAEEYLELYQEMCFISSKSQFSSRYNLASEATDVLVTLFNLVRAAGVSEEQFVDAIRNTWRKNDAKTELTHTVTDGFIVKLQGE